MRFYLELEFGRVDSVQLFEDLGIENGGLAYYLLQLERVLGAKGVLVYLNEARLRAAISAIVALREVIFVDLVALLLDGLGGGHLRLEGKFGPGLLVLLGNVEEVSCIVRNIDRLDWA